MSSPAWHARQTPRGRRPWWNRSRTRPLSIRAVLRGSECPGVVPAVSTNGRVAPSKISLFDSVPRKLFFRFQPRAEITEVAIFLFRTESRAFARRVERRAKRFGAPEIRSFHFPPPALDHPAMRARRFCRGPNEFRFEQVFRVSRRKFPACDRPFPPGAGSINFLHLCELQVRDRRRVKKEEGREVGRRGDEGMWGGLGGEGMKKRGYERK